MFKENCFVSLKEVPTKQNLLFINGHMNIGGVEKSLLDFLLHIDYKKYNVDLLLLEDLGNYAAELPAQVHLIFRNLTSTYGALLPSLKVCLSTRQYHKFCIRVLFFVQKVLGYHVYPLISYFLLGKKKYDCVIGFRRGICSNLAAYGVRAKKRIVWWHHGALPDTEHEIQEYLRLSKRVDSIVSVSNACAQMLQSSGIDSTKIIVIPNMLDATEIQKKAIAFNPFQKKSDKLYLVSVGRISPEKHFENVIYAVESLLKHGIHNFLWYIIGGGSDYEKIFSMIQQKGLEQYIIMKGTQVNPYPFIKNADLFVHSSYVESQGLVILEALSLGIPCVVTKSLGACEIISEGYNGILTEQNRWSFASKVEFALLNPALLVRIKKNATCPLQYSPNHIIKLFDQLLETGV